VTDQQKLKLYEDALMEIYMQGADGRGDAWLRPDVMQYQAKKALKKAGRI
jgi:hypothetical protein